MYYENKSYLIGCLGQDPEIRTFQNGGKVANLRIATTRRWKSKNTGEVQEETEWHSVAVTNEALVNNVERYLKKGSYVRIEGRLRTRKWKDQNGTDRYTTEIVVAPYGGEIGFLDRQGGGGGGRSGGSSGGGQSGTGGESGGYSAPPPIDDEIPF